MNFAIRFLTEYRYDAPVTDNLNAMRVRPATTSSQRVDDFHVRAELRDLAGANRLLPVSDPATGEPRVAETSRFVLLARWTFWD